MKKVLLASTALVLSAGVAAAEVTVGGDGRMGIRDGFNANDFADIISDGSGGTTAAGETDLGFSSRIRISFSASGETDAGLQFGGSIRADNAGGGASGTAGSVFVAGSFGKLSMGDVDGAARAAVGHISGVGYTSLNDVNEIFYIANAGSDPSALYEYSTGALGFYASLGNPAVDDAEAYAVGVNYTTGNFTFALGYEDTESVSLNFDDADASFTLPGVEGDQVIAGITAAFGDLTAKAIYGTGEVGGEDLDQYAVSLDFTTGATTLTGFWRESDVGDATLSSYGVGVAYDLGGGAAIKAGYANLELDGTTAAVGDPDRDGSSDAYDLGITFSF